MLSVYYALIMHVFSPESEKKVKVLVAQSCLTL